MCQNTKKVQLFYTCSMSGSIIVLWLFSGCPPMCSQAPWQAPARALCCPALALCPPRPTNNIARKTETILVHMFCSDHVFLDSGVGEIKDTSKRCSLICFILRPPGPQAQGWGTHSPQYGKRLLFCWVHCTGCYLSRAQPTNAKKKNN